MNALWTARMCAYKHSPLCNQSAAVIIETKIKQRTALLKKYKLNRQVSELQNVQSMQDVLLHEARSAKSFWRNFRQLIPVWTNFTGRKPRAQDITNRLLDIGYHHITGKVNTILTEKELSSAIGLLHGPRTAASTPLAYDLVELFRADLVDAEVLRTLRLKKKPVEHLTQKQIAIFLSTINKRLERKHYLKDFRQCHTYHYYMELQILKFTKAVNHKELYEPLYLPARHDSRCA